MVYVKVFLEDINDNRPVFYPLDYAASISTQSMPGTAVLRVTAHDKDEGMHGKVTYRIVLGNSPPSSPSTRTQVRVNSREPEAAPSRAVWCRKM